MSEKRPDKCSQCTKPCKIHLSQVIDGKLSKMSVCSDCPTAKVAQSSNSADMMQLAGKKPVVQTMVSKRDNSTACPNCGFTREDFKEKGRLGCSQCYETFSKGLEKVISKVQNGAVHKGKGTEGATVKNPYEEIAALKQRIEELVLTEEYEEAAKLRDRIRDIEAC